MSVRSRAVRGGLRLPPPFCSTSAGGLGHESALRFAYILALLSEANFAGVGLLLIDYGTALTGGPFDIHPCPFL